MISLSGEWKVLVGKTSSEKSISLPGTIGGSGLGEKITRDTEWFSGLYNPFWYEREEYKSGAGEDFKVPFLSQPRTYFAGKAVYERDFEISETYRPKPGSGGNSGNGESETRHNSGIEEFETQRNSSVEGFKSQLDTAVGRSSEWYLLIELSKWRVEAEIDGVNIGGDESLCAPFLLGPVSLEPGKHHIKITVDNSMLYPYRPDSHSVSDCLEAGWNGMAGKIGLISSEEKHAMEAERKQYAKEHPVSAQVIGRNIVVNGKAEYMRGTHFGGGFHETVYPPYDRPYWDRLMKTVLEWGFNFIRFHSFCPPEAAFAAADAAGVFLQVECGMWNVFNSEDDEMFEVLMKETRKILEWFGHHPSFIMLSPTNEPGGKWYEALKKWVILAKDINAELGYEGRRLFTAQSGWFYDTPPADITGTDYIYFHRSAYGPIHGGMIRNRWGWRGKDYSPSLPGCELPVLAHEMGQWCSYPDFDVIDKFKGGIRGGNYEIFRENARKNGVLKFDKDFVYASGRAQIRLLKEDFEANFRTKEIVGFEYLDLHDYAGQGTAQVGILDAFLDSKGYTEPGEFRTFNSEIVILSRIDGYVRKNTDVFKADFEVCNFSGRELKDVRIVWKLNAYTDERSRKALIDEAQTGEKPISEDIKSLYSGVFVTEIIKPGENTFIGHIETGLAQFESSTRALLTAVIANEDGTVESLNYWDLTIFARSCANGAGRAADGISESQKEESEKSIKENGKGSGEAEGNLREDSIPADEVIFVRTAEEAEKMLSDGKTVIFSPFMSDMDFECPSLGIRNVFWNAQMGPSWSRPLGIVVDTENPIFRHFPTGRAGGWEWEDILDHARGFNFDPKYSNIVRVVDDWNRNFPLSLIFEGRVLGGKLLFCAADLGGDFDERPAAAALKAALFEYASSEEFDPDQEIEWADICKHIKPMYKGMDIIKTILPEYCNIKEIQPEELVKLADINPNIPFRCEPDRFPVVFRIQLAQNAKIERLYVLPIQNDRDFPGVIREYGIKVNGKEFRGEWKNGFETQYSEYIGENASELEFIVYSTYSMGNAVRWYEEPEGYFKKTLPEPLQITAAALGIEYEGGSFRHDDALFWKGEVVRLGVTIEQ
ncbi:MAG: hypothetical protein J5824_10480 [Lachnospiraceae bacterium]|nr:hypothetical protein [Lachnospiraceae bacterium]